MNFISYFLPVLLYTLGIILLVVLIILGVKVIVLLDKVDKVVDDVDKKLNSLNGIFAIIDKTTAVFTGISDTLVSTLTGTLLKVFKRKKSKNQEEDDIDE